MLRACSATMPPRRRPSSSPVDRRRGAEPEPEPEQPEQEPEQAGLEENASLAARLDGAARQTAARILRTWLPMMFGAAELPSLCEAYGVPPPAAEEELEGLLARLTEPFTAAHLALLSRPPGGLVPLLLESGAGWEGRLDMYWRGALALHKMTPSVLQSLLSQRPHLHGFLSEFDSGDGTGDMKDGWSYSKCRAMLIVGPSGAGKRSLACGGT